MARPTIEPVTAANLAEFSAFLHLHLNATMDAAQWQRALQPGWPGGGDNHGYLLRDNGQIVGGIGALYAERPLGGRRERTCNITSWCVLDSHRQHSMRLAMTVIGQPGLHFTDFSPTAVVGGTLRFLKFQPLDDRQLVLPNLPGPGTGKVLHRTTDIEQVLAGDALQIWRDHCGYPWLHHVLVGRPGQWCHVIYKRRMFRRLPAAELLHVSHADRLAPHRGRLARHLLGRGLLLTLVEQRLYGDPPRWCKVRSGFNQKLFRSDTLAAPQVDYLYSETMAMDL
jgi:hypothetical protein